MTIPIDHHAPPALKPCPFCGQPLNVRWRKINPKASCETPECWGSKLPVLPLDVPEFVAAWNARPDEAQAASFDKLQSFALRFLDPEDLGYAVKEPVRDSAREALGIQRVISPCQGQNCAAINGVGHSPECLFEHFMSYTGYWSQPEPVRAMLKQAYFDGIDAGKPAVVWVEKRL